MDAIRLAVEKGEYTQGIQFFRALMVPEPLDLCWVGVCFIYENCLVEAELRLKQAVRAGEPLASIFLASLLFTQGQRRLALETLLHVNPETLLPIDAARWYRERIRYGWSDGTPKAQLKVWATRAWELVLNAPTGLQVAIATTVGDLAHFCGEPYAALAYLEFAVENGEGNRRDYAQLCRTYALEALERYDDAHIALDQITDPAVFLKRDLRRAALWQAQQDSEKVLNLLHACLPVCREQPVHEFKARMMLLSEAIAASDSAAVNSHQRRAEQLVSCPVEQAQLDHRLGLWLGRQSDPAGEHRLRRAQEFYQTSDEQGRALTVTLALAEIQPQQRAAYLLQASTWAASFTTPPNLKTEWRFLPVVFQALLTAPHHSPERLLLAGTPLPPPVRLRSLNSIGLDVDGQPIKLRLARAPEILCFLLSRGEATLKDIQHVLFTDVPEARSKNYFHQVRVEVAARVPGLSIAYDAERKVYRVDVPVQFEWDVAGLKTMLQSGPFYPDTLGAVEFLPGVDSEWAQRERDDLRRWVTEVGLETMETWYQSGEYQKCIYLAERLLPIDPLDEGLHTFLLNATFHLKGRHRAALQYRESAATFMRLVGEVPVGLQQLQRDWQRLN